MHVSQNSFWLTAIVSLLIGAGITYFFMNQYVCKRMVKGFSPDKMALNQTLRKLWADHVIWTRQYIVSAIADLPDQKIAADRLLKNQEDLAKGLQPFLVHQQAAAVVEKLLKEHILIAVNIIAAAKADNNAKVDEESKKWSQNAEEIADALSSELPTLKKADVLAMLKEHLALTTDEVVARLKQQWQQDVIVFDNVFNEILQMADGLTAAIVAQFPNKF